MVVNLSFHSLNVNEFPILQYSEMEKFMTLKL